MPILALLCQICIRTTILGVDNDEGQAIAAGGRAPGMKCVLIACAEGFTVCYLVAALEASGQEVDDRGGRLHD